MPWDRPTQDEARFRLPRRRSGRKPALWAIAVSIAVHLPLLLWVPHLLDTDQHLEPTQFDSNQEFALNVVNEQQERRKEDQRREDLAGQFVNLPAPKTQQRPEEARFRDQYDSRTDRETARRDPGRHSGQGPSPPGEHAVSARQATPPATRQPTDRPAEPHPETPSPEPSTTDNPRSSQSPANTPTEHDAPTQAETSPDDNVDLHDAPSADEGLVKKSTSPDPSSHGPSSSKQPSVDPSQLFPSVDNLAASSGGGGVDYLKDVPEGEKTLLNRKRSRYWSFMNRLKEQVVQEWSPADEYRRRDPHGNVYGVTDRYTSLRVTLNGDGSLRTIYISTSSGLGFYDDEAVRAMRQAAPFPNPPEGMKDQDGLIPITFGFLLDLHSGSMRNIRINRH